MNWLNYLLQVNLYLSITFAFYWLILRKETFFNGNRAYLMVSSVMAFAIPFWQSGLIQSWFVTEQVSEVISVISLEEFRISAAPEKPTWSWNMVAVSVYFIGFGYGLLRFSVALFKLQQLLNLKQLDGQAFSIFGKIFIDKKLPDYQVIHQHEEVHSRHFHSVDVFWMELVTTICWFNPIVHIMKNEIKLVHELIADQAAANLAGKKQYAQLLVATHFKSNANTLVNNFFNHSILKTRIMKLSQNQSSKKSLFKYAFAVPLFFGMMVISAANANKSSDLIDTILPSFNSADKLLGDITGKVSDQEGNPLPGANVIVNGTNKRTTTDINGNFTLEALNENDEIVISFVGYQKVMLSITAAENLNIRLIQKSINEQEVGDKKDDILDRGEVFTQVENNPSFPGGQRAMYDFVRENMKYPLAAQKANVEGRVFVKFIVRKDGSIGKKEILKGIGFGCDEEVIRILDLMPKWSPGTQNGKPVNVYFTMPFFFQSEKPKGESKMEMEAFNRLDGATGPPLFIVDGVEKSTLEEIKPYMISTISVLKGESAQKKYGDKGKNGVVEITLQK